MKGDEIDALVRKVQALPDAHARDAALDLVQAVMDLHAEGLARMMEIVSESESGSSAMGAFAGDSLVSGVLLLHDLHPLDLETRVLRALDRPEFRSRGASVELLSIDDGVVTLRVEGGHGLREAVEAAMTEAAPDAAGLVIEGAPIAAAGFVPLTALTAR